jgi:hypothetical protein
MTTTKNETLKGSNGIGWIMSTGNKFMPQITLEKPDDKGADDAAKKAAEEAAAKKITDEAAAAAEKAKTDADEAAKKDLENDKNKTTDREAELLKEVMKKKEATKKAEDALEDARKKLKEFEGLDPVEIRKLVNEKTEAEKKAAEAAGDFERVKTMMNEEHKKEIEKVKAEKTVSETALEAATRQINELTVGAAFSNSNFVKDEMVLTPSKARIVFGDHFELDNGVVVAFDKPKGSSNRTKLVNGSGDTLGFEDAIKKLVEADPESDSIKKSKMKEGSKSKPDGETKNTNEGSGKGLSRIQKSLETNKKK